jgi:enamine deaminase RidA (YjgF/YER057c/UK114 family)
MSHTAEDNLKGLGITLPQAPAPAANYVPYTITGNLVFISGQLPLVHGKLQMNGHVGENVTG